MKKLWMLILGIALTASLAGCGGRPPQNEDPSPTEAPTVSKETAVDVIPEPSAGDVSDESRPVEITVIGLTQQQAAEYEAQGIPLLGDGDSTSSSYFLVSLDRAVTELSLWRIEMDVIRNDSFSCTETECIGSMQDLAPGEQVILAGDIGEVLPTLGISFVTEEGAAGHDYLTISGKDGSPLLVAYEVTDAEQPGLPE